MNVQALTTLMNIDTDKRVRLTPEDTVQNHTAVIGMTGSGKTNTLYVLVEELAKGGIKIIIIDPEGDYGDLRFGSTKVVIVGHGRKGNHIDIELTPDTAADAADVMCRYEAPIVIVDVSGFNIETQDEFVANFVGHMWKRYQEDNLPPARLIIDEVQLFAPQMEKTICKNLLRDMARRARKRNLAITFATQEPQAVLKAILNATRYRIFHQVAKGTAMKAIKDLLPYNVMNVVRSYGSDQIERIESLTVKPEDMIAEMGTGDALFMIDSKAQKVHVRASNTFNPNGRQANIGIQLPFDEGAIDELKRLIYSTHVEKDDTSNGTGTAAALTSSSEDDQECIEALEAEIERLMAENAHLRRDVEKYKRLAEVVNVVENLPLQYTEQPISTTIDNLEINSLAVDHIQTDRLEARYIVPPATNGNSASDASVEDRDADRQKRIETRDLETQRRRYQNVLLVIKRQSKLDRQILSLLVDHDSSSFTADEIAAHIPYAATTIANNPPTELVKAKLVTKVRFGRHIRYRSNVIERAKTDFPLLDVASIRADIAKLAGE